MKARYFIVYIILLFLPLFFIVHSNVKGQEATTIEEPTQTIVPTNRTLFNPDEDFLSPSPPTFAPVIEEEETDIGPRAIEITEEPTPSVIQTEVMVEERPVEYLIGEPVVADIATGPIFSLSSDSNTEVDYHPFVQANAYYMIFRYLIVGGGLKYNTSGFYAPPSANLINEGLASSSDRIPVRLDVFSIPIKIIGIYPLSFLKDYDLVWLSLFSPYISLGFSISFPLTAEYEDLNGTSYDIKDSFNTVFGTFDFGIGLEYSFLFNQTDYSSDYYGSAFLEYNVSTSLGSIMENAFFEDVQIYSNNLIQHSIQIGYRFWFFR